MKKKLQNFFECSELEKVEPHGIRRIKVEKPVRKNEDDPVKDNNVLPIQ